MAVAPEFVPRVRRAEPMSRHTSWHVGGPAEVFFNPRDRKDLAAFLRSLPARVPVHWVGLGSNLLVRDGGIRGVVIATYGALERLERRLADASTSRRACLRAHRQAVRAAGDWARPSFSAAFPAPRRRAGDERRRFRR